MNTPISQTLSELGYTEQDRVFQKWPNKILVGSYADKKSAEAANMNSRVHICIAHIEDRVEELLDPASYSPYMILTPEGGQLPLLPNGEIHIWKDRMSLKDFLTERLHSVHWFQSREHPERPLESCDNELISLVFSLVSDMNLLTWKSGNISFSLWTWVLITPRGIDKSWLTPKDLIHATVSLEDRIVNYEGNRKPSIDTGVQAKIYEYAKDVTCIIHSHNPWVFGIAKTTFPYPCGALEEAEEIIRTGIFENDGKELSFSFVDLIHHGTVFFIRNKEEVVRLHEQWNEVVSDFHHHLREVERNISVGKNLFPIIVPEGIIGYVFEHEDRSISPRIHPKYQGKKWGKHLFEAIRKNGRTVKTINECHVLDVYGKHGFVPVKRDHDTGEIWLRYAKMSEKFDIPDAHWTSPIPFSLVPTNDSESFRRMAKGVSGIPVFPHPGGFGVPRKYDIHTGIDLYCDEGTPVSSVEDGEVVAIIPFTGPQVGLHWWLDTDAVLVEWKTGVVLYGEIIPGVTVGQKVQAGEGIGNVTPVLRHSKWRPTSMLHVELHVHGSRQWYEWTDISNPSTSLRDPTPFFIQSNIDKT